tara:strand:+ start:257 stop:580 length:324 start_codon:yes stop_codon:yes gene_type:complete
MATRPWRQEIELLQNYSKHKTFTVTTTDANATDVVTLAGNMEEANKISLVVELGAAYIEFDDDATTSSMYVPADEGYYDTDVWIGTKISVIRATSTNVRVRGIIWGR